jgi:hypothetical protein
VQESSLAAQKQIPHDKTARNDKPLSAELVYSAQQYGLPLWLKSKPSAEHSAHAEAED